MRKYTIMLFFALLSCSIYTQQNNWERNFQNPPEMTKPWVYWYWINDNISKEGITKDLEAMSKAGIGEALIGNVVDVRNGKFGKAKVLSPEWWSCVEHAISEAERLDMKVGMFNCPGWSQSGGPWVKSTQAMRYLDNKEYRVKGPQKLNLKLEKTNPDFQPLIVQAFPAPKSDADAISLKIANVTSIGTIKNSMVLFDGNRSTAVKFTEAETTILVQLKKESVFRSVQIFPSDTAMTASCRLEMKNASNKWILVKKIKIDRGNIDNNVGPIVFGPICESFKAFTAKEIRFVFNSIIAGKICEIELSAAPRLANYIEKQLGKMSPVPTVNANSYLWDKPEEFNEKDLLVDSKKVIDVTKFVNANNELEWNVPKGEWIIQYTGMTPTGVKNHPTTDEGRGYEVDKMNKELAQYHFDSYVGQILQRIPADKRKGFRHVVADSYETGSQNWTDDLNILFKKTYGYDPYPWLPVLNGRIVESVDRSERFLWDLRGIVANKISTEYVGGLRERCEQNGLSLWLENYGHWGYPGEFLSYGGASNDLGGEFWLSRPELGPVECRCATSAAHTYGKQVVSAEAFTSHWTFNVMPRDFRMRGDWAWTLGINHFVLHVYIHQPDERKPGVNAWFGTDFNRHNTWFSSSKTYFNYIRRSSAMLQSGCHVADVAYFISEDVPNMTGAMEPKLPAGYDYDFINGDVLLNQASVMDGNLVLNSGASYRILVLPKRETMRPELLAKITELVKAGATIMGDAPLRSPSSENYPACDTQVREMAKALWQDTNGKTGTEMHVGKGTVYSSISLVEAFTRMKNQPAIVMPENMLYTQRTEGNSQFYFISNQKQTSVKSNISFRVSGLQPELWDAVTGEMRPLKNFVQKEGRTIIPLEFNGGDSYFIVFRNKTAANGIGTNFPVFYQVMNLPENWIINFDTTYLAPAKMNITKLFDWTTNENQTVKYFSGKATYSTNFKFNGDVSIPLYIDLGKVEGIATVRLNGREIGTLWCYPYQASASGAIINGNNKLEVDIINCWWNRLIGDQQVGIKPLTYTATVNWNAKSELVPAGLIGPVRIVTK